MAKEIKAGVKITGKDDSGSAFRSLSSHLSKSEAKFKSFKHSMSGIGSGAKMAFGGLAIAGAAIGAGLAGIGLGIKKMVDETVAFGDELGKFGRQTGFSVERIQELDFIAKRNGISLEMNRKSIVKFTKSFTDLKLGTGLAVTAMKKIDPTLLRQLKTTTSAGDAYKLFLKSLMKIEDPVKRSTLAFAMFGKSGQQMLRLIDGGPKAFEALRKEAHKYGIMSQEDTAKTEAYQDAIENFETATSGLRRSLTVGLLPALTEAGQKLADFIAENRPAIVGAFAGVTKNLGDMVKNLIDYLTANPDAFKTFIGNAAAELDKALLVFREIGDAIDFIRGERNRQDKSLGSRPKVGFIPTPAEGQSGTASASRFGGARGFLGSTGHEAVVGKGIGALGFRGGMGMSGFAAAMTTVIQPEMKLVVDFKNVPRDIQPSVNTSDPRLKVSEGTPDYFSPGAFE